MQVAVALPENATVAVVERCTQTYKGYMRTQCTAALVRDAHVKFVKYCGHVVPFELQPSYMGV